MSVSAKRSARIELTAGTAGMDRGLADASRKMRAFQREQAREAKQAEKDARRKAKEDEKARAKAIGHVRSIGSGIMQGFGQALGLDAVGGISGAATEVLDYERALTRLQITADASPETMRSFSDGIMKASNATGLGRKDILDAAASYVALTGDMKTAQESTATWAKIAQATGTPIQDISSTAAAMSQQMHVTSGDMEKVFSGLANQGKKGAIELKDLAGLMAQIAPQWAAFDKGTGAQGVAELGAALQVVKRGFGGDAGETVTGLQSLLTALVKNAGKFEGWGVKVFDVKNGKKSMRDVFSIIDSISKSKIVNDPQVMEKAFGRVEAYRAYLQLTQNRQALEDLTKAADDGGVIQRDYDTYMNSSAGKIQQAWTQAKNAIAAAFTPERIAAFSGALVEAVKLFAKIVGYIDKTASWISHLGGPTQEERIDNQAKGSVKFSDKRAADLRKLYGDNDPRGREEIQKLYRSDADSLRKHAAEVYIGADAHGGMTDDEKVDVESAYKAEAILRAKADPWSSENINPQGGDPDFIDRVTKGTHLSRDDAQNIAIDRIKADITNAIRDGFAGVAVKIGSEPIQKAASNSIKYRGLR